MSKIAALLAEFSAEEIATGKIKGTPPTGLLETATPKEIRARVKETSKSVKLISRNSSKPTPTSS